MGKRRAQRMIDLDARARHPSKSKMYININTKNFRYSFLNIFASRNEQRLKWGCKQRHGAASSCQPILALQTAPVYFQQQTYEKAPLCITWLTFARDSDWRRRGLARWTEAARSSKATAHRLPLYQQMRLICARLNLRCWACGGGLCLRGSFPQPGREDGGHDGACAVPFWNQY